MKIRMRRGSLEAGMRTFEEIAPTLSAVKLYLNKYSSVFDERSKINVLEYLSSQDDRIEWDKTYIVLVDDRTVAFTDSFFD